MALSSKKLKKQLEQIVYEGFLQKESRILKTWRKRWTVITYNYLLTFKQPKNYQNPTEAVSLSKIINISRSDEETHRQFSFKIETEDNCFYLGADSNTDREKWMGNLGSLMIKLSGKKQQF